LTAFEEVILKQKTERYIISLSSLKYTLSEKLYLYVCLALLFSSCALEKKSGVNRSLQNLTANYNILFNANEILKEIEADIEEGSTDDYDELLPVFQDTPAEQNNAGDGLREVIAKANKIIQTKEQSRYLGDAYFILGKANYYNKEYFNAVEFFNYTYQQFKSQPSLAQYALLWKTRSLLKLKAYPQVDSLLDTALLAINTKKTQKADVFAIRLQFAIDTENYIMAEDMARKALEHVKFREKRFRWMFILAQVLELNKKTDEAHNLYSRISKSNNGSIMAFHADINRLRIAYGQAPDPADRIQQLQLFIKQHKHSEFTDQLYFQIAEIYNQSGNITEAKKNYMLSLKNNTNNQFHKGMTYLKLAEIIFKHDADYITAKKYYDSSLVNLPKTYAEYDIITKKSNNLEFIAAKFQEISKQDTLQMLARLDDDLRQQKVDSIINRQIGATQIQTVANFNGSELTSGENKTAKNANSTFYFYNSNAVSQGYADFKKNWGNRQLEDNWRISKKAGVMSTSSDPDVLADPLQNTETLVSAAELRQDLLKNIPLLPHELAQSNNIILHSYIDLANFYKDVVNDYPEAIATYLIILKRFPESEERAAIYYNLYRLYSETNSLLSEQYKKLLLSEFPQTSFAKIIEKPDFQSNTEEAVISFYNHLYDNFLEKSYEKAISATDEFLKQFPENNLASQAAYVKAIAIGHLVQLPQFEAELLKIVQQYPNNTLITPLVQQHLNYINENREELAARQYAILDHAEIPFDQNPVAHQAYAPQLTEGQNKITAGQKEDNMVNRDNEVTPTPLNDPVETEVKEEASSIPDSFEEPFKNSGSIFSMLDSTQYFFAIQVNDVHTNLASSRFGIGQFNRTYYQNSNIKHQLKAVKQLSQIIYIGRFNNLNEVKTYARRIIPILPDIMKVPKDKYNFFIITQENLDKLADQNTLNSYLDFYKENY
jgi:tetratricopeptide (TPR) repeat protein